MSKSEREKHEGDLREIQEENDRRFRESRRPAEVHTEIPARTAAGEEKGSEVELHVFGGHAYLNTHGEARFDRESLLTLVQRLQEAYQAVQV